MHLAERAYFLIALTAFMAIAGIWSSDSGLAYAWAWPAGVLLLGLAWESWWRTRYRLEAVIQAERKLLLGRSSALEFIVREANGRAATIEYARCLPVALAGDTPVARLTIPAGSTAQEHWLVEPVRLGPADIPAPPARLLGRLRLAWWHTPLALRAPLSVAPDTLGVQARAMPGNVTGEAARRRAGLGSELFQLREYMPGDPLSRIDWKASARRGSWVARDFTEDQHLEIVVVLDAGRASRVRAGQLDRLGMYANVAARFAEHAVRLDDRVGVVAYADRVLARVVPRRGTIGVRELRTALERMRTERAESHPLVAAAEVQRMVRSRALIIWLCDYAEPDTADELLRAVKSLRTKHFVIVANVEPRELVELAERAPRSAQDPWITIAALERTAAIASQASQLRDRGALVLSAAEAQLESRVLQAYLTQRRLRHV